MKPSKLQTFFSYILPVKVEVCSSDMNPYLEIMLNNGVYELNSLDANYSFGSLYNIFDRAFKHIYLNKLAVSNCLLLGLGGGSIINLIRKKYKLNFPISAVEIDAKVIDLGRKYFKLNEYVNLNIINDDALSYVKISNTSFDLIVIDLYINDEVPEEFHTREFVSSLKSLCKKDTLILFNKMVKNDKQAKQFNQLVYELSRVFPAISFLSHFEHEIENKIICVNVK